MSAFEFTTAGGALIVSTLALVISVYTLAKNRNSVSVYVAHDQGGYFLWLTNNSPHAVTIVDMGTVRPKGGRSSVLEEDPLRRRIDPRHVEYLRCPGEGPTQKGLNGKLGAYIELATGQRFYSRSLAMRAWGHLKAWSTR